MDEPLDITLRNETRTQSNYCELYRKIQSYFDRGKFTDVTITSKDAQEFKCHGLILAAASEYFDATFRGNWRENHEGTIKFGDVNGATFELFRQFAYEGMINLNDENVYAALRLSNRCGVHTLERLCVRYITERSIPTNCAIELFVLACAANITSLIPPLRDFILNYLRELLKVTGENVLRRIDSTELKTLLTNRQPQPREREEELWKVFAHWVNENYPRRRPVWQKVAAIFKFDLLDPPRDFIRRFTAEEDRAVDNFASSPVGNTREALLHMYVATKDKETCNLVTMNADFHLQPVEVVLDKEWLIKTATIGNQLYLYALQPKSKDHYESTFRVYSSVRLTDEQILMSPSNKFKSFFLGNVPCTREAFEAAIISVDPIYKRIYLRHNFDPWMSQELFGYDCESDRWSPINYSRVEVAVPAISFFDHRLYSFRGGKIVEAYDPRAGSWDKLRSSLFPHCDADKFCSHRGKLYATCHSKRGNQYGICYVKSEMYDPVAGEWREVPPTSFPHAETSRAGWLVSLENKLWIFRENHYSTGFRDHYNYRFRRFDSFIERWDKCRRVFLNHRDVDVVKDIVVSRSEY